MQHTKGSELKSGLHRAAMWLLGFAWLGLVFAGMGIAFSQSPHPRIVGWVLLSIAALVLIFMMDRWVRVFPALLAYGIIGGLVTVVDGHVINHPEIRVPRLEGILITLFFAAAAAVSFTFTKRQLKLPDRIALFVFVFCFFWQAVDDRSAMVVLGIGLVCLVLAWSYDGLQRRRSLP